MGKSPDADEDEAPSVTVETPNGGPTGKPKHRVLEPDPGPLWRQRSRQLGDVSIAYVGSMLAENSRFSGTTRSPHHSTGNGKRARKRTFVERTTRSDKGRGERRICRQEFRA